MIYLGCPFHAYQKSWLAIDFFGSLGAFPWLMEAAAKRPTPVIAGWYGKSQRNNGAVGQNLVPLVNIKIAGKWMFIPLKMVFIGIDS
jgi:threonine dehydrogenase-like Zn-dependent dehydrogenase